MNFEYSTHSSLIRCAVYYYPKILVQGIVSDPVGTIILHIRFVHEIIVLIIFGQNGQKEGSQRDVAYHSTRWVILG